MGKRREAEITPQHCHSLQPLQIPRIWGVWEPCPLSAGRETRRWGWDTVPGRAKAEPTTHSRICRHTACAAQGYLKQCFWDMEISIWVNHCFPHRKRRKWKMFPIPRANNFSHTTLIWFQLQGRCAVRYSPAQIQVNCFLRCGQEDQCCQRCLQHPQGSALEQRHLPWQTTEPELPATLPVPLLSREQRACPAGRSSCGALYLDGSWDSNSLIHHEGMIQQTGYICLSVFPKRKKKIFLSLQNKTKKIRQTMFTQTFVQEQPATTRF